MDITIRVANESDAERLAILEHESDSLFTSFDKSMALISDLPPNPPDFYLPAIQAGNIWVATLLNSSNKPVAFISIKIFSAQTSPDNHTPNENFLPMSVFVKQLSTRPNCTRRGIGKKLVQYVETWAKEKGFGAVELTTFAHVPFNMKWYQKLGYAVLTEAELNKEDARGVESVLEEEKNDEALMHWERVAMRKLL